MCNCVFRCRPTDVFLGSCKYSRTSSMTKCPLAWMVKWSRGEGVNVIRYGVMANIVASHATARGSIPRVGTPFYLS